MTTNEQVKEQVQAMTKVLQEVKWWDIFVVQETQVIQETQVTQEIQQIGLLHLWPKFLIITLCSCIHKKEEHAWLRKNPPNQPRDWIIFYLFLDTNIKGVPCICKLWSLREAHDCIDTLCSSLFRCLPRGLSAIALTLLCPLIKS